MFHRTIKILLPALQPKPEDVIYIKGYVTTSELETAIYFVKYSRNPNHVWEQSDRNNHTNVIYGICNGTRSEAKKLSFHRNYIVCNQVTDVPKINKLILNGDPADMAENCIVMLYEYNKMKATEIIWESTDNIMELQMLLQHDRYSDCKDKQYDQGFIQTPFWLSYSMFSQHVINCVNLAYWLYTTIRRDKKISIRNWNLVFAVVIDIMLGYFILQFLTIDEKELSKMLMGVLEKLVNSLYTLLKWLMGAPAGLKLNNAFNKMLGKYFSYHTQLWWLFLDVTGEKLDVILHLFHYIGYAGFTFQAAIVSDMICIATFHSYCIYVYAARLFNIQVSGLTALLRLFVGRKYNPLRGGIDSCEYTNQELFVGTVAFTILLLLMPTTAMYYAVFTLFRLMSLVVQHILAKLIFLMQTQPSYVILLWLINSYKVAGNILVEVLRSEDSSPLVLKLRLFNKSVQDLVKNFKPPVEAPKHVEWTNLLSNVLSGKQIV